MLNRKTVSFIIALSLCFLSVVTLLSDTVAAAESKVDATVINFNNGDNGLVLRSASYDPGDIDDNGTVNAIDKWHLRYYLCTGGGVVKNRENTADVTCDGTVTTIDSNVMTRGFLYDLQDGAVASPECSSVSFSAGTGVTIKGSGTDFSFGIDASAFDYSKDDRDYIVLSIDLPTGAELSAVPLYNGREAGSSADRCSLTETDGGYAFKLPEENSRVLTGAVIEVKNAKSGVVLKESFFCSNEYSALWICENRLSAPDSADISVSASLEGEKTAIRLVGMTDDDRNNTNGGMYHDFVNTKWPSIAVDENDNLYVVGSGNRMAHVDPFGNTLLTVSRDGGKTWGKPQNISNTVMDDRDAGILYLGNGEFVVSYFTSDARSYLPGGSNYSSLKPYSQGGSAPNWAAEWDSEYNPTGGIIGNYLDIIKHVNSTDTSYDLSAASYVIKSTDYGATWNVQDYEFVKRGYTSAANAMLNNYLITKPGSKVPVTSAHGPMKRSDGKVIFAGKVMTPTDRPMDSMAVYISDDGLSYSFISEIPTPSGYYYNNFHELSVTETNEGALVCAIRTQTCNDKVISPQTTIYTSFSYDGGATWTVPAPTGIDGTPPHLLTLSDGTVLLTYSDRTDPRSIRAVVSRDGGHSWSKDVVISENFFNGDDMGYPASAVLSDGTVVTVWYGTYKTGTANEQYSSIISKRWKLNVK